MYSKKVYINKTEAEILKKIKEEGYSPLKIANPAGYPYPKHNHPETKLLVILKGDMTVKVGGKTYNCTKGDKLVIPGNVTHSAEITRNGCTFFWSEKI